MAVLKHLPGFDPLGLCKNPEGLKRFTESEVIHCRWAMLGAAGCLGVEALGQGNWYDAPLWVSSTSQRTYSVGQDMGLRVWTRVSCIDGLLVELLWQEEWNRGSGE